MKEAHQSILVVEDERMIADILMDYLRQAGFAARHVEDGPAALDEVRRDPPDLVLLDVVVPGMDGLAVCREIRKFSAVPIIMVTSRVEEVDRLLGLELGADDYICKPFSPREVVARVHTVLRRAAPAGQQAARRFEVDEDRHRISVGGERLDLTPIEYRLLRLLMSHPGRIYTRAQILDLVYHEDQDVSDRIIDSHVKNLRKKIAAVLPDTAVIHAAYGLGYRFEP